jgi:hypothetical protein
MAKHCASAIANGIAILDIAVVAEAIAAIAMSHAVVIGVGSSVAMIGLLQVVDCVESVCCGPSRACWCSV